MEKHIEVRPARAEDKHAIVAFCQKTFDWGDYIPDVWDNWLVDPNGKMFVGVVDGQPVGMVRVAFLEDGAAWMEGMRVHPDFRRRGTGSAMDAAARSYARGRGGRRARLATGIANMTAQKTLATLGYERIAQFNEWAAEPARSRGASSKIPEAKPRGRIASTARVATHCDADAILKQWKDSEQGRKARGLIPNRDWQWTELTDVTIHRSLDSGEVRVAPRGFAILREMEQRDGNILSLHALVGDEKMMHTLASAVRTEASYRGFPQVDAMVADDETLSAALERAGYRREGGMMIYEQALG